ncbi:hypothetical protein SNOG_15470 [Parastagonospora nodorum SN15]|uniref:Uncharacterized protein n=1 Tax=Phaeosphaeria nodorum (strain SN15 / ATCC MYA-4574 / FGSC 10173) TaxID=321614 RepID=Q0TYC6_PHANO|nr:hypothetical protein SNOG_15470 [Parastagonospora nodorum SN15]EAT77135.1 hypothetical protein SNOG_15470 [Parastagonospora nodorum SN15]
MAPAQSKNTGESTWDPSRVVEVIALLLTVPGAIAALATLWIIHRQRQRKERVRHNAVQRHPPINGWSSDQSNARIIDWFQHHYDELQGEMSSEREQWEEEMKDFSHED